MLNKTEIIKICLQNIEKQLRDVESAAKASAALATADEHRAKSKYDTFSLETSYLARGQAKRVEETREALSTLRAMPLRSLSTDAEVQMGALVGVQEASGEKSWYFLVPSGGGEEVDLGDQRVDFVTLRSPIAQALLKKRVGDSLQFAKRILKITEIS